MFICLLTQVSSLLGGRRECAGSAWGTCTWTPCQWIWSLDTFLSGYVFFPVMVVFYPITIIPKYSDIPSEIPRFLFSPACQEKKAKRCYILSHTTQPHQEQLPSRGVSVSYCCITNITISMGWNNEHYCSWDYRPAGWYFWSQLGSLLCLRSAESHVGNVLICSGLS